MYSRKMVSIVTTIRDNQILKALLPIKKSLKSIDFDIAKRVLVSPPTHPWTSWVNFDWSKNYKIIAIYLYIHGKHNLWNYGKFIVLTLHRHSNLQLIQLLITSKNYLYQKCFLSLFIPRKHHHIAQGKTTRSNDLLKAARFLYLERFYNRGLLNLSTEFLKGFSAGVFNKLSLTHSRSNRSLS